MSTPAVMRLRARRAAFGTAGTTGLIAAAHLTNDMFTSVMPALLPSLAQRFGLAAPELAILVAIFALSTSLPQPLFGSVADRLGGRRVGALGLAVSAMLVALIGRAPSVPLLVVLLLVGGLGSAALHPAGVGMIRHLAAESRGVGLAVFTASGMLGTAIGPVVALALTARFGPSATVWLTLPGLLAAASLLRFAPDSERQSLTSLAVAHHPAIDARLAGGPAGLLTIAGTLGALAVLGVTSGIPLWLVTVQGVPADSALIGWTLATFSGSGAVGGLTAAAAARHIPRARLMVGTLLLSLAALEAVLRVGPGGAAYFALVALGGALLFAHTPLLVLSVQQLSPGREAAASGLVLGVTTATAGILYAGVARLQPVLGATATLSLVFTAVVPAALLAGVVLGRRPREVVAAPGRASGGVARMSIFADRAAGCACAGCTSWAA